MIRVAVLLMSALLLFGCTSPTPELFTLAPVPGEARPGGPAVVLLRDIGLAKYLDRPQIVRSTENYRVKLGNNERWGEPLGTMLSRVMVENLEQRLPGTLVIKETGAITATPNAIVEVDLQRLDTGESGAVTLVAQVARRGGSNRAVRLSVQPASTTTRDEVSAMSATVGQLADVIAGMLRVTKPDR